MPYEIIFAIPFVVGIVWIMHKAIQYEIEMSGIIQPSEFELVEKDKILYIVPKVHQD